MICVYIIFKVGIILIITLRVSEMEILNAIIVVQNNVNLVLANSSRHKKTPPKPEAFSLNILKTKRVLYLLSLLQLLLQCYVE